jgi:FixJ family two-component response regulator
VYPNKVLSSFLPVIKSNSGELRKGKFVSNKSLIAVIDDDDPFRASLVDSLLSLGYEARGFGSAEEFVTVDGQVECDCVITDVHMPGMSGLDLKRLLAGLGSKMPVIMITARTDPDLEAKATASGAICFLRKPIETPALLDCLKKALGA